MLDKKLDFSTGGWLIGGRPTGLLIWGDHLFLNYIFFWGNGGWLIGRGLLILTWHYIYIYRHYYIHYIYIHIAYATYDSAPQMNWTVMMGLSTAIWHVALSFSYWDEVGYSDDYHTTTAHFNSRIERISPGTHGISTIRCRQSKVRTSLNGLVWMKRTIRAWLASKVRLAVSTAAGPQISLSHCVKRESSRIFWHWTCLHNRYLSLPPTWRIQPKFLTVRHDHRTTAVT